jgi:hypothetical protein
MPRNSLKFEELAKVDVSIVGTAKIVGILAVDVSLLCRFRGYDIQSSFTAFCMP